jgi:hypothetical protein
MCLHLSDLQIQSLPLDGMVQCTKLRTLLLSKAGLCRSGIQEHVFSNRNKSFISIAQLVTSCHCSFLLLTLFWYIPLLTHVQLAAAKRNELFSWVTWIGPHWQQRPWLRAPWCFRVLPWLGDLTVVWCVRTYNFTFLQPCYITQKQKAMACPLDLCYTLLGREACFPVGFTWKCDNIFALMQNAGVPGAGCMMPGTLSSLSMLQTLDLSFTALQQAPLEELVPIASSLRSLNLSSNRIMTLPACVAVFTKWVNHYQNCDDPWKPCSPPARAEIIVNLQEYTAFLRVQTGKVIWWFSFLDADLYLGSILFWLEWTTLLAWTRV